MTVTEILMTRDDDNDKWTRRVLNDSDYEIMTVNTDDNDSDVTITDSDFDDNDSGDE